MVKVREIFGELEIDSVELNDMGLDTQNAEHVLVRICQGLLQRIEAQEKCIKAQEECFKELESVVLKLIDAVGDDDDGEEYCDG